MSEPHPMTDAVERVARAEECPCCGQIVPGSVFNASASTLLSAMQRRGPRGGPGYRDTYRINNTRSWALTHGHHSSEPAVFPEDIVRALRQTGHLRATYPGCDDCYSLTRAALGDPA